MKRKPLPDQEYLNYLFEYHPDSGKLIRKVQTNYNALKNSQVGYKKNTGYIALTINSEEYLVHKIVWKMSYGTEPLFLDHINRIKSDNRLENLREVTPTENVLNVDDSRYYGTSLKRGVYKHSKDNKWRSAIQINKKRVNLGLFDTEEKASEAYQEARAKYYEW